MLFLRLPRGSHACVIVTPLLLITSPLSQAASAINNNEQVILQQQRQRALEQQLLPPTPDVRLLPPASRLGRLAFPQEKPCFNIDRVELSGQEALPRWLPLQRIANQAQGQCLGGKGINLLMSTMQNRLVDHGYITTRVLAPQQDLKSGTLQLTILPGFIRQVKLTPDSGQYVSLFNAFPPRAGQLLDLRDIEQGLENLQRLPTVQAKMEIVPGEKPGESDILLHWQQAKIWRLGASLDDSGSKGTGRYQGGLTFSLDNPLSPAICSISPAPVRCNPVMTRAAKTSPLITRCRFATRCCQ
jgi:hemolysin activation/secretion protein